MYLTFAKHKIEDAALLPFNAAAYSRFKFGDKTVAKTFGEELALDFIQAHGKLLLEARELVIVPSPYNAIPTASGLMTVFFKEIVNHFLYQNNRPFLLESKIHRYNTYSVDYSQLNSDERLKLMASDTYHFHESFLNNKTCLFLDDIRVTGSHEQIIKNMLEANKLKGNFIFLYYAAFNNKNIPPNTESYLNSYAIKSLADACGIVNSQVFAPNTRIIKFILNSEPALLLSYLDKISVSVLKEIVALALQNNYHHMPEYSANFYALVRFIAAYNQLGS
jgi:predicted amidophosphoribosyltransferase